MKQNMYNTRYVLITLSRLEAKASSRLSVSVGGPAITNKLKALTCSSTLNAAGRSESASSFVK